MAEGAEKGVSWRALAQAHKKVEGASLLVDVQPG